MTPGGHRAAFTGAELGAWERIRRYAVPRPMIESATARRLAGDWRGACAAANIDVAFDVRAVAREHGGAIAAALESDLRRLAPDLLRWHLPRTMGGRTTIEPDLALVLAAYDGPDPARGAGGPWAASLQVLTPTGVDGRQRLVLRFGNEGADEHRVHPSRRGTRDWTSARVLWDARHTAELLAVDGGDRRAPFFHADGTPLTGAELPSEAPAPGDAAAHAEWVSSIQERGDAEAAFDAAGLELVREAEKGRARERRWFMSRMMNLTVFAREARRLAARTGSGGVQIRIDWKYRLVAETAPGTDRTRVRIVDGHRDGEEPMLLGHQWSRLPDLELIRAGRITPERLHPLVRTALFPERPAPEEPPGPPAPEPPAPVRVRCQGGEWHEVVPRDGTLDMPHTPAERDRERALLAFGGALSGCFEVQRAWTSGRGRLPKGLRAQRRELFLRAQHGDTAGVLRLLDAGFDPHVRNGRRQSLLHLLHLLDHEELLPRLLEAGLGLEEPDHHQCTPLHTAAGSHGSPALVRALLDAGARIDTVDDAGASVGNTIRAFRREDLGFLRERIDREHPGIGVEDWNDWEDEEE